MQSSCYKGTPRKKQKKNQKYSATHFFQVNAELRVVAYEKTFLNSIWRESIRERIRNKICRIKTLMCVNASVKYWKFFSRIQTSCCKGTQPQNQDAIRLN